MKASRFPTNVTNGENINRTKSYHWLNERREEFIGAMMDGTQRAFDKHAKDQLGAGTAQAARIVFLLRAAPVPGFVVACKPQKMPIPCRSSRFRE